MWGFLITLLVFALSEIIVSPVFAGQAHEERHQRETLRGLQVVRLEINIGLAREGPTRQLLRSDVEQHLREIPLRVLPQEQGDETVFPALVVNVAVLKKNREFYFFVVTAQLFEKVILERDTKMTALAATWTASHMGDGDLQNMRESVAEVIRNFYQAISFVESLRLIESIWALFSGYANRTARSLQMKVDSPGLQLPATLMFSGACPRLAIVARECWFESD